MIEYRTDRYERVNGRLVRHVELIDPAVLPADLRVIYETAIADGHRDVTVWPPSDHRRGGAWCQACGCGAIRNPDGSLDGSLVDRRPCRERP